MAHDAWASLSLGDLASEITVGFVGPMVSEYHPTGIPFLRSQNIEPFRINSNDLRFIGPEFHARIAKSRIRPGDVVIVRTGTPGISAVVPEWLDDANCADLVIVRPGNELDAHFLVYYLNSVALHHIDSRLVGAVQQHFNVGSARELPVVHPPVAEQRRIVGVLRSIDDKIELNRRTNQTLESMARAIFRSWFVDFDPVVAKAEGRQPFGMSAEVAALFPDRFVESAIGPVPQGWPVRSIDEILELNPIRSLQKGDTAPYLEMANLPKTQARVADWESRAFSSGMKFRNGDVLLARITPCLEHGKTAYVDFLDDDQVAWGSTEYIVLRSRAPIPPEYAYFVARSEDFRAHAITNMTGSSGRQRVPASSLAGFPVVYPPAAIAQKFGLLATSAFAQMKSNDEQSRTLATLRDTLLPKLMSGELRIRDVEKLVGAHV